MLPEVYVKRYTYGKYNTCSNNIPCTPATVRFLALFRGLGEKGDALKLALTGFLSEQTYNDHECHGKEKETYTEMQPVYSEYCKDAGMQ